MIGKKFKKVTAALLSALIMLSALCITVSADNIFEDSKKIEAGKTYSCEIKSSGEEHMYKIEVEDSGKMVINLTSYLEGVKFYVYDSDGVQIDFSDSNIKAGYKSKSFDDFYCSDDSSGVFKGSLTYKVKSGTYYLVFKEYIYYKDKIKFSVSLPDSGDSSQTKVSSTTIMLNMSVGDKIDLSAVKSGKVKSDAAWSSSDKKIAKVSSKGVITAVKSGQCTITWKSGSTSFSILVNVE